MILIIDIPDEQYNLIKLSDKSIFADASSKECMLNSIKKGIPYDERTQGDLISREALKRVITIECNPYGAPTIDFESGKRAIELIDRAPAVYDNPYSDGREDGYIEGYEDAKRECDRPQGEWVETGYETGALGITYRQTQCSNCGWEHTLPMWWNFCPNCGADMRKGGLE